MPYHRIRIGNRIGSWDPPGTGDRRNDPGGDETSPHAEVEGHATPGERARRSKSSVFFRILREGGAKQGKPAPRPRLEKKGIREEVVK